METAEKTKIARKLYEDLKVIRAAKDLATWYEGEIFYKLDKEKLFESVFGGALSKAAFLAEIDVPVSTERFKRAIYEFYVIEHKFTMEELKRANTQKLHRAIPFVRGKTRAQIEEVIDYAEREKQGIRDFLHVVGAPVSVCDHLERGKIEVDECKHCLKILRKNEGIRS